MNVMGGECFARSNNLEHCSGWQRSTKVKFCEWFFFVTVVLM